jgi:hypothetical protein
MSGADTQLQVADQLQVSDQLQVAEGGAGSIRSAN